MSNWPISRSIINDNRAVSPLIAVILLFGFLIIGLSVYQAESVPQQNAETEFQHSQEVRNDLVDLRAGILQAGSTDQPQYQTVQLGTTYSTRIFSINPPAPAGAIRTSEPYPIRIEYPNGTEIETIPTRFIEYQPGYNELDRSPTWYEASVLYVDASNEGGGTAVIEDQNLFDNGTVQITAIQKDFRRSGTGRVTIKLQPAESVDGSIPEEGDLNITIPTRLSDNEYWKDTDIPNSEYNITNTSDDGVYNLTLETTASNLTVDTVGVQEAPEDPTQNDAARVDGRTPSQANFDVTIDSTNSPIDSGETATVDATIKNTGNQDATQPITLDIEGQNNPVDTQDVTLASGESMTVRLEWTTGASAHSKSPYAADVSSDDDSATIEIKVKNPGNSGENPGNSGENPGDD